MCTLLGVVFSWLPIQLKGGAGAVRSWCRSFDRSIWLTYIHDHYALNQWPYSTAAW
jgi:hypothetical protein